MKKTEKRKCGIISIGVPWSEIEYAEELLRKTCRLVEPEYEVFCKDTIVSDKSELRSRIADFAINDIDVLIIQVASFPDGELPLYIAERVDVPIIIHSIPEPDLSKAVGINSMCGANMINSTLHNFGRNCIHLFGNPDDPGVPERLMKIIDAASAVTALRGAELGLMGFRAPGFYPCVFDEVLIRKSLGIGITHIGLNELEKEMQKDVTRNAPRSGYLQLNGEPLPEDSVKRMEHAYGALSNVVKAGGLSAYAIKDWPEFFDPEVSGGTLWPVLGWLQEDEDLIVAPEGDVTSGITMMIQKELRGEQPSMVDISAVNTEKSALLLWHYGNPENLARDQSKIRYCEFGREVQFTFKPGRATLVKLGQKNGQLRLLSIAVEMMDEEVTIRRAGGFAKTLTTKAPEVMESIFEDGWEHHLCLSYGDIEEGLDVFSKLTNIPYTKL